MAVVLQQWGEMGYGIYIPALESDLRSRQPKNWGESAKLVSHLAFADDLILIAKSDEELRNMYRMMVLACEEWGLTLREDMLCLRSSFPGSVRRPSSRRPV